MASSSVSFSLLVFHIFNLSLFRHLEKYFQIYNVFLALLSYRWTPVKPDFLKKISFILFFRPRFQFFLMFHHFYIRWLFNFSFNNFLACLLMCLVIFFLTSSLAFLQVFTWQYSAEWVQVLFLQKRLHFLLMYTIDLGPEKSNFSCRGKFSP